MIDLDTEAAFRSMVVYPFSQDVDMARESGEFQISELLKITAQNKYAAAVAAFEVVDNAHMLDLPPKWGTRKAAVQAMMALSRDVVQFDFISDEQREKLEAELQISTHRDSAEALFRGSPASAPVLADSEDDLDEIGEIIDERMEGGADEVAEESPDSDSDSDSESGDDDAADEDEDLDDGDDDD